jgi:O-antigen/teichoic acid export membrane protein
MALSAASRRSSLTADPLALSVAILVAASLLQRAIGFGRSVLFCRWLSPAALGEWDVAQSFLLLAAPLAVLGVPGTFGRYAEHYRAQGQLRTFVRRTAWWTAGCSALAVAAATFWSRQLAGYVFGDAAAGPLMRTTAWALGGVILLHTMTSLLTALRMYRVVTVMNFAHSLLFAGLALAWATAAPTSNVVAASYGIASLLAGLGAWAWAAPALRSLPCDGRVPAPGSFWSKLLRFALFVWLANLLGQLFAIADRYMIVHCSGMDADEALQQVGIYHSSRLIPVMVVSFAELLGGLVMPYLSHEWENGRREQASRRLNLAIKLTAAGMLAFSAAVLVCGPFLFEVVLDERYADGLAVMPWTMAGCVWYGIFCVAQNYLWCAERNKLATVPFAVGLALNVALNLLLLPVWGLYGAVFATACATGACLAVLLLLNRLHGQHLDAGCWIAAAAPLALAAGAWSGVAAAAALIVACLATGWVLNAQEQQDLRLLAAGASERLGRLRWRGRAAAGA